MGFMKNFLSALKKVPNYKGEIIIKRPNDEVLREGIKSLYGGLGKRFLGRTVVDTSTLLQFESGSGENVEREKFSFIYVDPNTTKIVIDVFMGNSNAENMFNMIVEELTKNVFPGQF